ncbi:hemagglutinin [Dirofilaria immitis]
MKKHGSSPFSFVTIAMKLLMKIALLSWVLVIRTENVTNSSIREITKIAMKELIKISSSEKEFKTLDEMMQEMNERLENNLVGIIWRTA